MTQEYQIIPSSVACCIDVKTPQPDQRPISVIWLNDLTDSVVGNDKLTLQTIGWPAKVIAQIEKHFKLVYSLPHNDWEGQVPTPRTSYVKALKPWTIYVPE